MLKIGLVIGYGLVLIDVAGSLDRYRRQAGGCKDCTAYCSCLSELPGLPKFTGPEKAYADARDHCKKAVHLQFDQSEKFQQCMKEEGFEPPPRRQGLCPECENAQLWLGGLTYPFRRGKRQSQIFTGFFRPPRLEDAYNECMRDRGALKTTLEIANKVDKKLREFRQNFFRMGRRGNPLTECRRKHCGNPREAKRKCAKKIRNELRGTVPPTTEDIDVTEKEDTGVLI